MARSEGRRGRRGARAAVRTFVGTVAALCATVLAAFYAYDPLMIFHAPWGRAPTLHESMRLQAAGIINNVDFDGVILGTSMMENTSGAEAGRLLGGRFVNLSITASDYFERGLVLRYLLRKRKVRTVIYSLDMGVFGREGHPVFRPESFAFLYDLNPFNDFRAYATPNFVKCALRLSDEADCVGRAASLDRPNAWYRMPEQAMRFGGLDNWFAAHNDWQVKAALASISADAGRVARGERDVVDEDERRQAVAGAIAYVERQVLSVVEANPETHFHLIFPPYSRIRFAQAWQLGRVGADTHEAVVRHLARRAGVLGNLSVYGFEDQDFLDDIAHYKDTAHYDEGIDEMILHSIASGAHRLSADTVETYLEQARGKAAAFDLVALGARIDAYLASQASPGPGGDGGR